MKLAEVKNPDFYNEEEDIILSENLLSEIIYIINELYCIIRNKKDKSEKIKRLKRQITFFVKPYLAK